ncbi:hypothetical protein [Sphaerospermopsis sp. LEGE 08334]|nr:hypothetical protein [Sphaerospermopsis sp. LEGE 08334]MBE9056733.1 hypothetical protein [Sphaerospermopsis sp. LEGE 08334]
MVLGVKSLFEGLGMCVAKRTEGIAVLESGGSALALAYRRYRLLGMLI